MDIWDYFDLEHCIEVLTDIFASLTLPVVLDGLRRSHGATAWLSDRAQK
jgi:hypothetical protein